MGILADMKAIKDVQKIKNGGIAKLSISQITGLIVNMMDARQNLDSDKFQELYRLFTELRKCNTKIKMDIDGYTKTSIDIIKRLDLIAPYEKYSGGNELEFSFFMQDIRKDNIQTPIEELSQEEINYSKTIVANSNGMIDQNDADDFIQILHSYRLVGKDITLENFENLKNKIIERSGPILSITKISFLLGVLNSNGIINENEMNVLGDKYQEEIMKIMMNNK